MRDASFVVERGSGCESNRESGLVQNRAPSRRAVRSGEDTVFCLNGLWPRGNFLIFDRVKREYLGERRRRREDGCVLAQENGWKDLSSDRGQCRSGERRASSCETCCEAGFVPASDGFSDQAFR